MQFLKANLFFRIFLLSLLLAGGCSKANKTTSFLNRAARHVREGKLEAAKIEYINVLRLDGTNATAIRKLGDVFFLEGEFRSAFAFLTEAKKTNPQDADLLLKLAQIYQSGRQVKEARTEAQAVLQISPTNDVAIILLSSTLSKPEELPAARNELAALNQKIGHRASFHVAEGNLFLMENKLAEAETSYKEAEKLDPRFGYTYLAQANLYMAKNELEKADHAFEMAAQTCEDKPRVKLAWADFKTRSAKLPEAKKIVEEVRKSTPDYFPALAASAEIALHEKEFDQASELATQMLARDGKSYDAQLLRARIQLAKNEPAKAVELLEALVQDFPKLPLLRYQCAQAYIFNNQLPKAVTSLNTAITLNPDFIDAILLLAQLELRKGEYPAAVALLTDLTRKKPGLSQGYLLLGKAYEARKTPDDALNLYTRYSELFPKDANGPFLIGMLQATQFKNLSKARQSFEKALQLAPDNLPIINQLIELDIVENKFQSALARAEELSTKFPKSATPVLLIAKVHSSQKNFDQAEAALLRAIKIEPESSAPYLTLAQLYSLSNKRDQALEKLNQAVTQNPNDAEAWMLIGMVHDLQNEHTKSADAYRHVLKINRRFSAALNNLAYLDAEFLGNLEEAYDLARKAREYRQFDPYTADTLGWVLYRKGQYPQALDLLKESSENLPGQPEILYHLGMTHYALDEEAPARQAFEAALNTKTDFKFTAQVQERLAILNLNTAKPNPETLKMLEARVKQDPNDVLALARLADVYEKAGQIEKALQTYEIAQQKSPTVIPIALNLARLYSEKAHDPDKAIKLLKGVRATAPDDPAVAQMLGRLAYQKGDVQWALGLLQESAQKQNTPPEVLVDLANAYYSVGRVTDAENTMRRALAASPNFSRSNEAKRFLSILDLQRSATDPKDAQAKAAAILKTEPNYLPALMLSAIADEKSGGTGRAKETYDTILKTNPQFAPAMKRLAFLNAGSDNKKAFELGSKAKSMLPDDRELPRFLGLTAFQLADYASSIPFLSQAISQSPNDAEVLYHLGLAHYQLKHSKDSKDALRRALALDQKNKLAPEAQQVLAQLN